MPLPGVRYPLRSAREPKVTITRALGSVVPSTLSCSWLEQASILTMGTRLSSGGSGPGVPGSSPVVTT